MNRTTACQRRWVLGALLGGLGIAARAHDFKLGSIQIDHPYALPTPDAARTAALYFRALRNLGEQPDRLVAASTPLAQSVEFHSSRLDTHNVMRMRQIEAIELAPRGELHVRHGGTLHLMLIGLKAPLKDGERFPLRLRFEKAGQREVTVWVQQPRDAGGEHRH
jgi:copper(I)-binding protein